MILLLAASFLLSPDRGVLAAPPDTGRRLVLVTNRLSNVVALSATESRKLFLGIPIEQGSNLLLPLRNQTDPVLYEVFLQKAMFMSAPMYERTLLTRLLRTKGTRPQIYETEKDLLQTLLTDPNAVTFMWADRAESIPDLRIVVELWHE
ncbi:MAG: hypothetical protein HZB57_06015 [Gammaproteobacteria bacterium]|nr:hypothetical protein [Gammaproteobacteria bacterium]